jgi:hypothetical protein
MQSLTAIVSSSYVQLVERKQQHCHAQFSAAGLASCSYRSK